jgi:hypothetical protein
MWKTPIDLCRGEAFVQELMLINSIAMAEKLVDQNHGVNASPLRALTSGQTDVSKRRGSPSSTRGETAV